jgi:hypothetical protein
MGEGFQPWADRVVRTVRDDGADAVDVLPLTPVPSLIESWVDAAWGFLDVMERVNLPSLERALGVR